MYSNTDIRCKNGTCYIAPIVFVKSSSSSIAINIISFKLNAAQTAVETGTNVLTYKRIPPTQIDVNFVHMSRSFMRNNEFIVAYDNNKSSYSYKKNGAFVSLAAPTDYKWVGLYLMADS